MHIIQMKINNIIKEEIKKLFINEGYYDDKGVIRLYHRIGMMAGSPPLPELIKSVYQNGLIPKDNGEVGKVIWFSDDYNDYAQKGNFVVAVDFDTATNGYTNNEYGIRYDGHNAFAINTIPFDKLIIIKIPVLEFTTTDYVMSHDKLIKSINGEEGIQITPDGLNDNPMKPVIYADIFNKYVQPYINYPDFIKELNPNVVKIINVLGHTY